MKMRTRATRIFATLIVLSLLTLAACSSADAPNSSAAAPSATSEVAPPSSSSSGALSNDASQSPSSTAPHPARGQSEAPPIPNDNPEMSGAEQPPLSVNGEQALDDCLAYLTESLNDEQHGGIHRVVDYNGSGLAYHGGADIAEPYILIWVFDKTAVGQALESYAGQKPETVLVPAAYSLSQLNGIMSELQTSEISTIVNSMMISEDNKVMVVVMGKENVESMESFLQSYTNKGAVSVYVRSESNANPAT